MISSSAQIVGGETAIVVVRLFQLDKKIRYIPSETAEFSVDLLQSNGDVLTKSLSFKFEDDDRSILQLELDDEETQTIISQNLIVKITEGADIRMAVLQQGLQKVNLGKC
jgi:hypothetical protein